MTDLSVQSDLSVTNSITPIRVGGFDIIQHVIMLCRVFVDVVVRVYGLGTTHRLLHGNSETCLFLVDVYGEC